MPFAGVKPLPGVAGFGSQLQRWLPIEVCSSVVAGELLADFDKAAKNAALLHGFLK